MTIVSLPNLVGIGSGHKPTGSRCLRLEADKNMRIVI